MNTSETLRDFYEQRLNFMPESLKSEIGHFNIFTFEDLNGCSIKPIPYSRREYYKISYIKGHNKVHFADKTITINRQALLFANPQVPYNWEQIGLEQSGFSCVFTSDFFHHFGDINAYQPFKAGSLPIIELSDDQASKVIQIFEEMSADWSSEYVHKYDRMRILVFELLHLASKAQPTTETTRVFTNSAQRITTQFLELLERQFPVEDTGRPIQLHSPSDFANRLSIHVNHLNKALKKTIAKPTSVIINDRILMEAKILLKHSTKDVAEIAYALAFKENTHFNNFFKKHTGMSPTQFAKI